MCLSVCVCVCVCVTGDITLVNAAVAHLAQGLLDIQPFIIDLPDTHTTADTTSTSQDTPSKAPRVTVGPRPQPAGANNVTVTATGTAANGTAVGTKP